MPNEKARSQSLQTDFDHKDDAPPPRMKRSETMPNQAYNSGARRKESTAPAKGSSLRQTEINDSGLPTPSATPDYPNTRPSKYNYGKEYADDREFPTPDGYRTEVIEPANGKPNPSRVINRSPEPLDPRARDRDPREKLTRASSSRYPETRPHPPRLDTNTRTTSYKYTPSGVEALASPDSYSPKQTPPSASSAPSRPKLAREDSMRSTSSRQPSSSLYGEVGGGGNGVPSPRSPNQTKSRYSPPGHEGGVQYQPEIQPKDIKYQTGYGQRRGSTRPSLHSSGRGSSYTRQPVPSY